MNSSIFLTIILCIVCISINGKEQLKDFFIDENGNVQLNEESFSDNNYDDELDNYDNDYKYIDDLDIDLDNNFDNNTCNNNSILNNFQDMIINNDNLNEFENLFAIFSNWKLYEHIFTIKPIKSIVPKECEKKRKTIKDDIIEFHFEIIIDENSLHGEIGSVITDSKLIGRTVTINNILSDNILNMCIGEKRLFILPKDMLEEFSVKGIINEGTILSINIELVSRYDHMQYSILDLKLFNSIDENNDGNISENEFFKFMISKGHHQNPNEFFQKEDKNGDGFISIDEFTGPK